MSKGLQAASAVMSQLWRKSTSPPGLALLVAIAAFLLYWRTAAPDVLTGDSGELQFAAWGFWLAHPTGYPLYLILGGIWQHVVPIGNPAFRMNLFSAFWSALAVGIAFAGMYRVTHAKPAATIAALAFAVTPLFWSQATRAEVYALNTFFVALLTLWGVLWRERGEQKYAIALAITFGLSFAHHRTTILLLPALAALFADKLVTWAAAPRVMFKSALLYALFVALPLLLYLYIPLRTGATPYAVLDLSPAPPITIFENSPRGWLAIILGSGFSGELGLDAASWNAVAGFPEQWVAQLTIIGLLVTFLGFAGLLWQKRFAIAAFVSTSALTYLLFNSVYHIGDIADYYTPIYFFSCFAMAAGIAWVASTLRRWSPNGASMLPGIALLAIFAFVVLENFSQNFVTADRRYQPTVRAQWEGFVSSDLPENAILLSNDRDDMTPMYYLQLVEHVKPDWVGIFPRIAPGAGYENVISLVRLVAGSGRQIYAIKPIPALSLRYDVEAVPGGLWRINPVTPGTPRFPGDALLGDSVRVPGYSFQGPAPVAGDRLTLSVQYVPLKPLLHNFTTSVQLFDAKGHKVAQGNDHIPGDAEYPSSRWRTGETILDQFDISLDPGLEPGIYKILLSMYDPASGIEVGELTEIGTIRISR